MRLQENQWDTTEDRKVKSSIIYLIKIVPLMHFRKLLLLRLTLYSQSSELGNKTWDSFTRWVGPKLLARDPWKEKGRLPLTFGHSWFTAGIKLPRPFHQRDFWRRKCPEFHEKKKNDCFVLEQLCAPSIKYRHRSDHILMGSNSFLSFQMDCEFISASIKVGQIIGKTKSSPNLIQWII